MLASAVAMIAGLLKIVCSFVVVIFVIAFVHELGHYIAAKLGGVRVDEFSIGFGHKLWSRKWGETEYAVRSIPLGAFVRPAGMDPDEEYEPGNEPGERGFNAKPLWIKLAILFAGPVANIVLTVLIASGAYYVLGYRDNTMQVSGVLRGKPAHKAGIRPGDVIVAIDGETITNYMDALRIFRENPGRTLTLTIRRPLVVDGREVSHRIIELRVTPEADEEGIGRIGVIVRRRFFGEYRRLGVAEAFRMGLSKTLEYVSVAYGMALKMIGKIFSTMHVPSEVGGPVRIAAEMRNIESLEDLVWITAGLSLGIGVFNLLPIPALDGGRILLLLLGSLLAFGAGVLRFDEKKVSELLPRLEEWIHLCGFAFLILMFLMVTWKDVLSIARGKDSLEPKVKKEELVPAEEFDDARPLPSSAGKGAGGGGLLHRRTGGAAAGGGGGR